MKISTVHCVNCGATFDASTRIGGTEAVPQDGDITVCLYCRHIMVFEGGKPRNPNDAEMRRIAGDPRVVRLVDAIAEFKTREIP